MAYLKINVVITQDGQECGLSNCNQLRVWELPEKAAGVFAEFSNNSLPVCLGIYPDESTAAGIYNEMLSIDTSCYYMPGQDKGFKDVFFKTLDEFCHNNDGPRDEHGRPTVDREKVEIKDQAFNTGAMAMYYWLYKHSNFDRDPEFEKLIVSGFDKMFFDWMDNLD